jgi:hypothetical protein
MVAELGRGEFLYQQMTAHQIAEQFGEGFTFINNNGNRGSGRMSWKHLTN